MSAKSAAVFTQNDQQAVMTFIAFGFEEHSMATKDSAPTSLASCSTIL
jgi:hypothetical protein